MVCFKIKSNLFALLLWTFMSFIEKTSYYNHRSLESVNPGARRKTKPKMPCLKFSGQHHSLKLNLPWASTVICHTISTSPLTFKASLMGLSCKSPTHTPHFFRCRHFKKRLKRQRGKWNEVATYEVQVLHACITICRPNFEVPVWQNSSFLSSFLQILERNTTSFKSFLAAKTFCPKQPHRKWFNLCQEEFENGKEWF